MSRQTIAVDIDDTMVVHFQYLINWYNERYGTQLTLEHNHPTVFEPWGTDSDAEAIRRVHQFFDTPQFRNAKPFKEAVAALRVLDDRYNLVVVTSRDTLIEQVTLSWLDEHFTEVFKDVHFTAIYSLEGKARSKIDVCRSIGASYIIDDVLDTTEKAATAGMRAVLFGDYPWNKADDLPKGVTRCKDWPAVLEYFDGR